jgi:hypothetical protein
MKKNNYYKIFLSIIIFALLSLGLTGCDIDIIIPEDNASVTIDILGSYYYNIKVDGVTKLSNIDSGVYTITVPPGNDRHFEAIDIRGKSYGYDDKYQDITTGSNTVYLDPVPAVTTGTVYVVVSGDWYYDIKMDGEIEFTNVSSDTYTIPNVTIGDHTFEAIDTMGTSFGYDSETKYIYSGSNYVYLYP